MVGVASNKSDVNLMLRMIFGELPLPIVVLVDFAIKLVWLTSLISLCLMTITNACYLLIFNTINNISDAKIVTTLKIVSIVASIVILGWRQLLLVRIQTNSALKVVFALKKAARSWWAKGFPIYQEKLLKLIQNPFWIIKRFIYINVLTFVNLLGHLGNLGDLSGILEPDNFETVWQSIEN